MNLELDGACGKWQPMQNTRPPADSSAKMAFSRQFPPDNWHARVNTRNSRKFRNFVAFTVKTQPRCIVDATVPQRSQSHP